MNSSPETKASETGDTPQASAAEPGSGTSDAPEEPILQVESEGGTTWLTLNRPRRFNALSEAMLAALQAAIDGIGEETRVVVIRAKGKAFCAGHDLKEMRARPEKRYYQALFQRCSGVMRSLAALPQPVIAEVQGIATAAGCQLVATCDLVVAADTARFAVSGIDVGLFCSTPAVPLSRVMTRKRAFEMLVTGEFIDAATALDWGLINRSVPADELHATVTALADRIKAKSAVAVATGKGLFGPQLELGVAEAYALAGETMACNMMADDAGEGIDAFIGKRAPDWKHR